MAVADTNKENSREISLQRNDGEKFMDCRIGCGACCIAISISSPIKGMPEGKPAGVRCVQLAEDHTCRIYDERPAVCRNFRASEYCGDTREEAIQKLSRLEEETAP